MNKELDYPSHQGQIGASRISSNGMHLYASPVEHNSAICIRIQGSKMSTEYGRDFYSAKDIITEVVLSPHQWSEFLTNMNFGDGVPCTVRYRSDVGFIPVSNIPKAPNKILEESKNLADNFTVSLMNHITEIETLAKEVSDKPGKKAINQLLHQITVFKNNLSSNARFYHERILETGNKVVEASKAEISAHHLHALVAMGVQKVKELGDKAIDKFLPSGDSNE